VIPRDPLTNDQLDWLGEILLNRIDDHAVTEGLDEGVIDIPELDGFLTAIVSGPVVLVPSRWLPALWGDFEPIWNSVDEHQRFMSLLIQHSNNIAGMLMEDPADFEPLFEERRVKDRWVTIVDEWCEGYVRAVRLAEDEWRAGGQEITDLLAPIRAFTGETNWYAHALDEDEEVERLRNSIAPNVRAIHAKWLAGRSPPQLPARRDRPRVGRNDPCPCGSGKKYKHCCLH
jgi:uncharacterized protein